VLLTIRAKARWGQARDSLAGHFHYVVRLLEKLDLDSCRPGHLPVITLAKKAEFEHSPEYRESVATDVAELLFGIEAERSTPTNCKRLTRTARRERGREPPPLANCRIPTVEQAFPVPPASQARVVAI